MNDKIYICPHCGGENIRPAEFWLDSINNESPAVCTHCSKPLTDGQERTPSKNDNPEQSNFITKFLVLLVAFSALLFFLNRTFDVFSFKKDSGRIIYGVLMILFISSALASGKMWQKIKHLLIWFGIFLILLCGYSYRHELNAVKEKVTAELIPSKGYQQTPNAVSFPASSNGHFYIRAQVNGIPITFLADTGASSIVLTPSDAEKLGMEPDKLVFDRFFETANGTGRGSSVRIDDFRIGGIHFKDIGASVNEAPMSDSLLGMTFFKRLKSYEVKNDVLTLYWNR